MPGVLKSRPVKSDTRGPSESRVQRLVSQHVMMGDALRMQRHLRRREHVRTHARLHHRLHDVQEDLLISRLSHHLNMSAYILSRPSLERTSTPPNPRIRVRRRRVISILAPRETSPRAAPRSVSRARRPLSSHACNHRQHLGVILGSRERAHQTLARLTDEIAHRSHSSVRARRPRSIP